MELGNTSGLVLVIGILAIIIAFFTIVILLLRKRFLNNTIRVGFISKGGHIQRKRYKRSEVGTTIDFDGGKYAYDPKAEVTTRFGKEIYYPKDSKTPIYFTNGAIDVKSKISPENFKAIIETELIAKLFKKEIFNTENILIMVAVVSSILGVVLLMSIKYGGVKLADTPENIELIKKAVTSAIKGV